MSKSSTITRRQFGGLVAAGAALPLRVAAERVQANPQQPDYVPPPRPLVPDVPPFAGKLEYASRPVALRVQCESARRR